MKTLLGRVNPTLPLVVVGLASLLVFMVMQPWWLLHPSTPTGGDMGHNLAPIRGKTDQRIINDPNIVIRVRGSEEGPA